jgi:hypothetical protein
VKVDEIGRRPRRRRRREDGRVSACMRAVASTFAAACATAPGSTPAGASRATKRGGRWPHRVSFPRERLAHERRLPAGQLDEPLDRNKPLSAACLSAKETSRTARPTA